MKRNERLPYNKFMPCGFKSAVHFAIFFVLAAFVAVFGLKPVAASAWQEWVSGDVAPDRALGRIWSVSDQRFVAPQTLITRLSAARSIVLGEIHDNPVHHHLQAFLVGMVAPNQRPAVFLEMLSEDQSDALEAFRIQGPQTADGFADRVDWQQSGWPDFQIYRPLIEAALSRKARIEFALPGREATQSVSQGGLKALPGSQLAELGLTSPLEPKLASGLRAEIMAAHCDLLPIEAVPNMSAVQRFRDAHMAAVLRQAPKTGPAFLITGNGHVRKDRGVPLYLDGQAVSVMLQEVAADMQPDQVAESYSVDYPADYIWLTQVIPRDDPCAALKERFSTND
ncbi:hypothetical protein E1178_09140 [Roseibium hamelinense]|nr:ChaN family lipoprotein [Roseibium hamelinense]MTI43774.1 hypothetical protein [Roseibium hamelinense]